MLKIFATLFLVALSFLHLPINAKEPISLTINIISHSLNNGAGKEVDVAIIKEELETLGHHVSLFDYYKVNGITPADINIFLAQFIPKWFSEAKLNWFIPNPEFCNATLEDLQKFDLILCKTKECLRIFKSISKEAYYLGFTSIDRHVPSITKKFSKHLHVAGKSKMKGTEKVIKAWRSHSGLPSLILIRHRHSSTDKIIKTLKNVKLVTKRIPSDSLLVMQNECGIHLCPSKTEGFGHYIMEAMSAGAVIITTDAPPMNEFIRDKRCLVKYSTTEKKNFATTYIVDDKELANTVKRLQQLSYGELESIGQRNREKYLSRAAKFKQNFEKLMNKAVHDLYENDLFQ